MAKKLGQGFCEGAQWWEGGRKRGRKEGEVG